MQGGWVRLYEEGPTDRLHSFIVFPEDVNLSCVHCFSDEENDEDLDSIYYLPVAPEVDDPEETGWTQEVR